MDLGKQEGLAGERGAGRAETKKEGACGARSLGWTAVWASSYPATVGAGSSGASGFTLRLRPRNGWMPNSVSFSARRP